MILLRNQMPYLLRHVSLKDCDNNNEDEVNSPIILSDKNVSSYP